MNHTWLTLASNKLDAVVEPGSFPSARCFMANNFDGRSDVFPDVYQLANGLPLRHALVIGKLIDRDLDRVQQLFVRGHWGAPDLNGTRSPLAAKRISWAIFPVVYVAV